MPAVPIIAAVTGASAAIGTAAAAAIGLGTVSAVAATAIGTGIVAGAVTAAQGGDISDVLESAVVGGATSFVGGTVANAVGSTVAEVTGSNIAGAAAGGASRALVTGGDAEDVLTGGLLGGIGAGIGDLKQDLRQEEFDTAMTESGLAGQTATSPSDFLLQPDVAEAPTIKQIIDGLQTVQPDYSLSAPEAAPGLKPNVIDTSNYQIGSEDYSLGSTENADVVDGFGLTQDLGASIGDPNSFINQPLPEINYTLPEFSDLPPVDNSGNLAALGVAETLVPIGINALVASNSVQEEDPITGFGIVPIPEDWRSPIYNQEFTPSAPIDFGSLELLRGTQFERPSINISELMNVLNNQSLQPQAMPQFGLNQIVGNVNDVPISINDIINNIGNYQQQPFDANQTIGRLNGSPASLASIISGIQSQYG